MLDTRPITSNLSISFFVFHVYVLDLGAKGLSPCYDDSDTVIFYLCTFANGHRCVVRAKSALCECYPHRNVIGGIDGSHIRIPGPDEELLLDYYNYKNFYSIVRLATVDHVGRFRWFCSGWPGSCRDSGVLRATAFYKLVQEEFSKPMEERKHFTDRSCILGDSAFAEGVWMRTPITLPQERAEPYFGRVVL